MARAPQALALCLASVSLAAAGAGGTDAPSPAHASVNIAIYDVVGVGPVRISVESPGLPLDCTVATTSGATQVTCAPTSGPLPCPSWNILGTASGALGTLVSRASCGGIGVSCTAAVPDLTPDIVLGVPPTLDAVVAESCSAASTAASATPLSCRDEWYGVTVLTRTYCAFALG